MYTHVCLKPDSAHAYNYSANSVCTVNLLSISCQVIVFNIQLFSMPVSDRERVSSYTFVYLVCQVTLGWLDTQLNCSEDSVRRSSSSLSSTLPLVYQARPFSVLIDPSHPLTL